MNTDLRDRGIGEALDRLVGDLRPNPEDRLRAILRRGRGRRALTWAATATVLALFVGGAGWAALVLRSQDETTLLDTSNWATYRDPEAGWSLRHPSEWYVQSFEHGGDVASPSRGVLLSSVEFHFRHRPCSAPDPEPCPPVAARWDMRGLPPEAVVLEVRSLLAVEHGPPPPDSSFPLSLEDAYRIQDSPAFGAPQPRLLLPAVVDNRIVATVSVWFGPEASATEREAARRVVASIAVEQTTAWARFSDVLLGWSFEYPDEWHVQLFDERPHRRYSYQGVLVSNAEFEFRYASNGECRRIPGERCAWDMEGLPEDAVVLELSRVIGGPYRATTDPDTPLPLSLDDAEPRYDDPAFGAPQPRLFLPVVVGGTRGIAVSVWVGPEASSSDREAVSRVVASIRFGERLEVYRERQTLEDLWGRIFVSVSVTEGGEPRPLVADTRIEVTFEKREDEGVVRWKAGCNIQGATIVTAAGRLLVGEISGTQMACRDELREQDEWLAGFFSSGPRWELDGDRLTLRSGGSFMELEERV